MRLRTQLTLIVTALVALVVALAGLFIVVRIDHRDRDDLDRALTARADRVRAAALKNGSLPTDGTFAIRLIDNGEMLKQVGSSAGFPLPVSDGFSTVSSGDDEWRSRAETLVSGAQLQILVSLDDLKEQHDDNVLIVDLLVLLAAVLSAAGVWFATGLVLRPFQRLLNAARDLDPADADQRLPEVTSPREVAELTTAFNNLLVRARTAPTEAASPAAAPKHASATNGNASASPTAFAGPTMEMRAVEPAPSELSPSEPSPSALSPLAAKSSPAAAEPLQPAAPSSPAAKPSSVAAEPSPDPAEPEPAAVLSPTPEPAPEPMPAPVVDRAAELRPSLADLGVQLDQLMDNPEMPATQRHLLLAQMADEHRRMVAVVEGDV